MSFSIFHSEKSDAFRRPLRMSVGLACCLYSAEAILGLNEIGGQFRRDLSCCYNIHC